MDKNQFDEFWKYINEKLKGLENSVSDLYNEFKQLKFRLYENGDIPEIKSKIERLQGQMDLIIKITFGILGATLLMILGKFFSG